MPESTASLYKNVEGNGDQNTSDAVATEDKPTYVEQFKGDLKDNEIWSQYPTLSDVGDAFIDMKGKLENAVLKPGENATDDERAAYAKALGIPESPDDYKVSFPDGVTVNKEVLKATLGTYHKLGLNETQAQALLDKALEEARRQDAQDKKDAAALDEADSKALAEAYGDNLKETLAMRDRALIQFGGQDLKNFFESAGLANNPLLVQFANNIAKVVSEDRIITEPEPVEEKGMQRTDGGTPFPRDMFPSMKGKK